MQNMIVDIPLFIIGTICVLMGFLFVWIGDRELPEERIFRVRLPRHPGVKWLKWPMGLALISVGVALVAQAMGYKIQCVCG